MLLQNQTWKKFTVKTRHAIFMGLITITAAVAFITAVPKTRAANGENVLLGKTGLVGVAPGQFVELAAHNDFCSVPAGVRFAAVNAVSGGTARHQYADAGRPRRRASITASRRDRTVEPDVHPRGSTDVMSRSESVGLWRPVWLCRPAAVSRRSRTRGHRHERDDQTGTNSRHYCAKHRLGTRGVNQLH